MKISNQTILAILSILFIGLLVFPDEMPAQVDEDQQYWESLKHEAQNLSYQECQKRYPQESYPDYYLDCWSGTPEEEAYLDSIGYSNILY